MSLDFVFDWLGILNDSPHVLYQCRERRISWFRDNTVDFFLLVDWLSQYSCITLRINGDFVFELDVQHWKVMYSIALDLDFCLILRVKETISKCLHRSVLNWDPLLLPECHVFFSQTYNIYGIYSGLIKHNSNNVSLLKYFQSIYAKYKWNINPLRPKYRKT